MRACAGDRRRSRLGGYEYPPSRFWLLPGPRRWQGAAPQAGAARLARQPTPGEAAHAGRLGHRLPVQVTEDLSVQVTEG